MRSTVTVPGTDHASIEHFAAAVVLQQERATRVVVADPFPSNALRLAEQATAQVSRLGAASPDRARRACRAGCPACCHLAVSLTAPEALLIAEHLRRTRHATEVDSVRARIADVSRRVSHLTIEQRAEARVACALLGDKGECTVYEARPIGCRGWTSFSRDACEQALDDAEPGHAAHSDRLALAAATATTEGLQRGLRGSGIDGGHYEFHGAVLRALETPRAAERWARGEAVFADCPAVRSQRLGTATMEGRPRDIKPGRSDDR